MSLIMNNSRSDWTILVYRIPTQPSRLRLLIWRKLQAMGALYLQNAVCLLPARPDLDENLQYVAAQIDEMGGTCFLFAAAAMLPGGTERLKSEFRAQADSKLEEIIERLDGVTRALDAAVSPHTLERAEGELKRERAAYLRAKRLTFFGSTKEVEVDQRLEALKGFLDSLCRIAK